MTWICFWDQIYGVYPLEKAYRPDSEEGVLTQDGKRICNRCANKYREAKRLADQESMMEKLQSTSAEN